MNEDVVVYVDQVLNKFMNECSENLAAAMDPTESGDIIPNPSNSVTMLEALSDVDHSTGEFNT